MAMVQSAFERFQESAGAAMLQAIGWKLEERRRESRMNVPNEDSEICTNLARIVHFFVLAPTACTGLANPSEERKIEKTRVFASSH
jgi:hypothetical protein